MSLIVLRRKRYAALFMAALVPISLTLSVMSPVSSAAVAPAAGPRTGSNWSTWQKDVIGSRFNPQEKQFTEHSVQSLKLKWAFVFPDVDGATSSQPAVVDNTLYVGSRDAKFYALDATTGATKWVFDVTPISGPIDATNTNALRDGPSVVGNKVIFGDYRGYVYALNKDTGALIWATRVSDHALAALTGSPLVHRGRVYIGVSSSEAKASADPGYPCCTFRGQLVALNLATGAVDWRYYTTPQPVLDGTWPDGSPRYAPAGAPVWNSPAIDPISNTVYFGTGQSYSGTTGDHNSVIALDAKTGALRWKQQMNQEDTWTVGCIVPSPQPHCEGLEGGTNLDYDFGASPNVFITPQGRRLVGIGQKSGVYHTFDARTGEIVWQQQVGVPQPNGGWGGVQWGSSFDGKRLYVATWQANPGTLFALDPADGHILWRTPNPANGCSTGGATAFPSNCNLSHISAVTTTPDLVYEGSADGKMRIYRARDGQVVWEYDTIRQYTGVNGATGSGGSVSGNGGAVVANGMLYVQSGYYSFYGIPGRVLLAFGF
ncbi:outer membrane protein assembly factor BamB family protein [Micromonospora carbonacea]|uniref:Polyvinyl alcohol dehydrogenase (Cytochrome) n=1 Tax=Micromonospora carbonacea TaxID=47853 RepID=A0A1C4VD38_9ACTN|nr:PQQ-binding-like beta-propeller repeat protein [Micromonospora carbonacea]SCE81930.1 polyvinyl alcohol dehydrogenase (cytochrome) [Micromonospora carbonacea]